MKKGFILTVMLTFMATIGFSQTTFTVRNLAGWIEAINGIRNGGNGNEYTINVTGNISVPAVNESTFGSVTGITVTIEGNGTLSLSSNGNLLQIGKEQTIIAKDLILKGKDANNDAVVRINEKGIFRMEGKATITGNKGRGGVKNWGIFTMSGGTISGNTSIEEGGGVYNRGTFTMSGGTISGNTSNGDMYRSIGGGVYNDKTFTMSGGTISGNTATLGDSGVYNSDTFIMSGGMINGNKGCGVFLSKNGTFTMSDGTISGNNNGGVLTSQGTFIMNGGTISGNTSERGGGVMVFGGTFTMNGGTISSNKATRSGGGVYISYNSGGGFFEMKGGTISGNTATIYGAGVYVDKGRFEKTGGTVYGDDADQKLKNTVISRLGHTVFDEQNKSWRNITADLTATTDSYGFWLNDGDVLMFPSSFVGTWQRSNPNNHMDITTITAASNTNGFLWILQKISGNTYTLKRIDSSNTMTINMKYTEGKNSYDNPDIIEISGDSGSGQNNWNGTWRKVRFN